MSDGILRTDLYDHFTSLSIASGVLVSSTHVGDWKYASDLSIEDIKQNYTWNYQVLTLVVATIVNFKQVFINISHLEYLFILFYNEKYMKKNKQIINTLYKKNVCQDSFRAQRTQNWVK